MKLIHHRSAGFPQMYHDYLANAMYRVLVATEWGALSLVAPLDIKYI